METFDQCFDIILTGDRQASRLAARHVRKLVYGKNDSNQYRDIKRIIESAASTYLRISDTWRQENFVMAVSVVYFLHDRESQPDFLFPWLFHLIQHPSGNVRYAAVRMFENELGPLTVYIRWPDTKMGSITKLLPQKADLILYELFANLNDLAVDLWKPDYKRYKYISSLPSGVYKSVQMVLSTLEEYCGKDYVARMNSSYDNLQIKEHREAVVKRVTEGNILDKAALTLAQAKLGRMRKELEDDMLPHFLKLYPNFDFKNIVSLIYDSKLKFFEIVSMIGAPISPKEPTLSQTQALLDLISTIWNIYPHKELDGYSPYEISAMYEIAANQDMSGRLS